MQPGKDKIIKCPYCDKKFVQSTIMSGNTMGAKMWTDGKQEAPMLPDAVVVSLCHKCNKYFWVEDAEIIDEIDPGEQTYEDAARLKSLTLEEYIDALKKIKISSDEDTFYLLRQIWWKYNDYYRENNESEISQNIKNIMPDLLHKLLNMFDEYNNDHLLMKGELLRELGQFEAAVKTLNKVTAPKYTEVKQFIIDLAKNEVTELKELEV